MKRKIKYRIGIMCLVLVMVCGAVLQYSDWLHAQDTTPFKYTFEEKLDELLSISNLSLKIEKSDKITITDVKYEEEILSFNEVNNEFVFVREFKENGKYEFIVSYQEKIEKEVAETATSKEDTILKQAGIEKEPSVEDIPVDKVEEASKNIIEKKIVEDWSETKTMTVEYTIKDIQSKETIPSDKVEPVAPDKIETVDKEPVTPKDEPTEEVIPPVEKEEPVVPKEEEPIEKEEPVVPKEDVPVEEPVTPKEEPIEEVSKSCYEVNNGVIVGLKATNHTGCENKDHLILDIPSIIDEQRITEIGKDAFINHTEITKVILPDSIIKIGEKAFANTTSLLHITIMGEIQEIHMTAFEGSSVKEIDISHQYESKLLDSPWGASKEVKVTFKPVPRLTPPPVMSRPKTAVATDQSTCFTVNGGEITGFKTIGHEDCTNPEHKNVVIPEMINNTPITSIGTWAFRGYSSLTSIVIPNNVTSIGNFAFYECSSLTNISIPDSVTSIGEQAFQSCSALTSITIPNSVTSIGSGAFLFCSKLTSIAIPNGVTSIGFGTFSQCSSLTNISIPNSVTSIDEQAFYQCTSLTSITIPNSVTSIGNSAFGYCSALTSISIPNSVISIGTYAFNGCASLTSISIPNSVTSIGDNAFSSCNSLTSINIPDSVTSIGNNAFIDCYKLKRIDIEKNYNGIPNAPWGAPSNPVIYWKENNTCFEISNEGYIFGFKLMGHGGCTKDHTTAIIPATIENIAVVGIGANAFYNNASLKSVNLPDSITTIGEKAFYNDISIMSGINRSTITFGQNVSNVASNAFSSYFIGTISIAKAEGTIEGTPWGASGLAKIEWQSLEVVSPVPNEYFQFSELNTLTGYFTDGGSAPLDIIIPSIYASDIGDKDVLNIDKNSFAGAMLNSIQFASDSKVKVIREKAFYNSGPNVKSIKLPNSVETIGKEAFTGNSGLEVVTLGSKVKSIGESAFSGLTSLKTLSLNSGLETIGINAFKGCSGLETIVIPNTVTSIGAGAFTGCTGLKNIIIGKEITSFDGLGLSSCTSLVDVSFEGAITTLPDNLFNAPVEKLHLPSNTGNSVTGYPWGSTKGNKLRVYWQDNGTCFDYNATTGELLGFKPQDHSGCKQGNVHRLADIPASITSGEVVTPITSIASKAFYSTGSSGEPWQYNYQYLQNLTKIVVPNSITSIGNQAFFHDYSSNTHLTEIHIGSGIATNGLPSSLFNSNQEVSIYLPTKEYDTVTGQPWGASNYGKVFWKSSGSCFYTDGNGKLLKLAPVGHDACTHLGHKNIIVPNTITSIGSSAFQNSTEVETITLPNTVTSIGDYAFKSCTALTSITIPDSVTSIGNQAFYYCSKLTSITIPNTLTSIGHAAFSQCTSLTNITLPDSVTSIGSSAFSSCRALTSITLPANLVTLESGAFSYCTKLTEIRIPSGISQLYGDTFSGTPLEKIHIDKLPGSISGAPWGSSKGGATEVYWIEMDTNCYWMDAKGIILGFKPSGHSDGQCPQGGNHTKVNIPNKIGETEVLGIGDNAFSGLSSITEVTLPNTITSIGNSAFKNCSLVSEIILPSSLITLGDNVFEGCKGLVEMNIPNSVTGIGQGAFQSCSALQTVKLPNGLTTLNDYLFNNCTSLQQVDIPETVTSIGNYTFQSCTKLLSVTIPESVKRIGTSTFSYCTSLVSIVIPNTVNDLGNSPFSDCLSLKEVVIGKSVSSLKYCMFSNCPKLEKVTIKGLIYNSDNSFLSCNKLEEIIYDTDASLDANLNFIQNSAPVSIIRFPKLSRQQVSNLGKNPFGTSVEDPALYFENNDSYFDIDASGMIYVKPKDHAGVVELGGMDTLTNLTIPATVDNIPVIGLGNSLKDFSNVFEIYYNGTVLTTTGNGYFNIPSLRRLTFNKEMTSFTSPDGTEGPLFGSPITDLYFSLNTFGSILDERTKDGIPYTNWGKGGEMRTHFNDDHADTNCFYINDTGETIIGLKPSNHSGCQRGNDHSYLEVTDTNITKIGERAFSRYGTNGVLEGIDLPNSLMEIGAHAFEGSTKLKSLAIPNSVTEINDRAFAYSSIESITFGTDLTTIGSHILNQVTLKEALTLGEDVTTVSNTALSGLSMELYDWEGAPTNPMIQIRQVANQDSFHGDAPWGMSIPAGQALSVLYVNDIVYLETSVAYNDNKTTATITYTVTAEDEVGAGINQIKEPNRPSFTPTFAEGANKKTYRNTFEATLNSREYNKGKGYEFVAQSLAHKVARSRANVNKIIYINMAGTDNTIEYYDFNADELDVAGIISLTGATAKSALDNSDLTITSDTSIEEIRTALKSQGGEAYLNLESSRILKDYDDSDINYVKKLPVKITAKYGQVTANNRIMDQTEAKNLANMDTFKTLLNTQAIGVEVIDAGANEKTYTTMEDEAWENFKNGEVGEYTVTSHLGREIHESTVKVVKEGSTIATDKLSSVYGYDIELGLSGAPTYSADKIIAKMKPEYETIGATDTTLTAFSISTEEMEKLQNVTIDTLVELTVKHNTSSVTDKVTATIVDDSPDTLVEIPQEVVLNKTSDQTIAATGEGTIKLIATKEHLSDRNIDIKTSADVTIKYVKDFSDFTTVDVYTSNDSPYAADEILMTLNSSVDNTKQGKFKLKLSKTNEDTITRGMFEGKMNFIMEFRQP